MICQIISGIIYQKMISESENMSATENRFLKQCKQKYANYYKLNGKMVNTGVFVDKFLQKIRVLGIRLNRLNYIAGQMMMLSVLTTRGFYLPFFGSRKHFISDHTLLFDQYTGIIFIFFCFRNCRCVGKEKSA